MDKIRADKYEKLVALLHEADALQQEILGGTDYVACYEFHATLNNMAEEFECYAAEEEQDASA
jgi:hypothetical protein